MTGQGLYTERLICDSRSGSSYFIYDVSDLPCIKTENYTLANSSSFWSVSWQSVNLEIGFEKRFLILAKRWKTETINMSSIQQKILHPAYQAIIALGPKVIPHIFKQLNQKPDFWFWALQILTGENPITEDMRGDLMAMRKAWLDWESENANM